VPLTALQTDIETDSLPNFLFIKPNICNDSHDCDLDVSDAWLTNLLNTLIPALDATGQSYFIAMLFEEGQGDHTCCGLPEPGGGRVPVVLYSPLVKNGFEDSTPYTHYSLLKTISEAWGLQYLGHAADENHFRVAPGRAPSLRGSLMADVQLSSAGDGFARNDESILRAGFHDYSSGESCEG
jgi:hypothetical protein